jgi:hypothetical protein
VFEQASADNLYIDTGVPDEFNRYGGAMGNDGRLKLRRQMLDELYGRRAAIDKNNLSRPDHGCRCSADGFFTVGSDCLATGEIGEGRRSRQRPAMYPLQQSFGCEFPQITPDRVFRQVELLAQGLGDDLPGILQYCENVGLALLRQHVILKFA